MAQREHLLTLDGLRGVAAAAVVLYHIGSQIHVALAPAAYLAVDLFFILSGFVIAHAYEQRFRTGMTVREFAWARIKRLYPLYFAGLVIGLSYALIAYRGGWSGALDLPRLAATFAVGLFMLPTPQGISGSNILFPLNIPAWSLFFELCANAVYAVLAARLSLRRLAIVIGLSVIGGMGVALAYGHLHTGAFWSDILGGFPRVMFSFFAGILLFRLLKGQPSRVSNGLAGASLVGLAALLVVAQSGPWRDALIVVFVFIPLVALCARIQPTGPLAETCDWLGRISYALYATHSPVLGWMAVIIAKFGLDHLATGPLVVLRLVPILTVAVLADVIWDVPARQWLGRRRRRPLAQALRP